MGADYAQQNEHESGHVPFVGNILPFGPSFSSSATNNAPYAYSAIENQATQEDCLFHRSVSSTMDWTESFSSFTVLRFQFTSTHAPLPAHMKMSNTLHEPQEYTGGRWLQHNLIQRASRYINFDYDQLCQRVLRLCPTAQKVQHCGKLDGGFNRVLALTLDNGQKVIARLPTAASGPERLITNSEVATISLLAKLTKIPVPRILDWSDDPANPVGAEYILMEHMPGIRLQERWATMNGLEHMQCTKALSALVADMSNLPFAAYGSVYFTNSMTTGLPIEQAPEFCIGPHCGSDFWNCDPHERRMYGNSDHDHGPWRSLDEYSRGLLATAKCRIPLGDDTNLVSRHEAAHEHLQLICITEKVMERLVMDSRVQLAAVPMLFHPDFHKRNIYVSDEDPTIITGVLDWQSTTVEPAFVHAMEEPDFARYPSSMHDEQEGHEIVQQEEDQNEEDLLICYQVYDVFVKGFAPRLQAARSINGTLSRPFRNCHLSARIGAAAVREDLIQLSRRWDDLGLIGSTPYAPDAKEIAEHEQRFEEYQSAQRLKTGLMRLFGIAADSWVQETRWEQVKADYERAFKIHMETFREGEAAGEEGITEDLGRRLWPWNNENG